MTPAMPDLAALKAQEDELQEQMAQSKQRLAEEACGGHRRVRFLTVSSEGVFESKPCLHWSADPPIPLNEVVQNY